MPARLQACSKCNCNCFKIVFTDEPEVLPKDYGSTDRCLMGGSWVNHIGGGSCECGHVKSAHTLPVKKVSDCPNISLLMQPSNTSARLLKGREATVLMFWTASGMSFGRHKQKRTCAPPVKEIMSNSGGCVRALEVLDELASKLNGSHLDGTPDSTARIRVLAVNIDDSAEVLERPLRAGPHPKQSVTAQFPNIEHAWTNESGTRAFRVSFVPNMVIISNGQILAHFDGLQGACCPLSASHIMKKMDAVGLREEMG